MAASRPSPTSEPSKASAGDFVLNISTNVVHKVLVGVDVSAPTLWKSCCGWRFASGHFSIKALAVGHRPCAK
eukprot:2914637-Amphidinium_carterae.1